MICRYKMNKIFVLNTNRPSIHINLRQNFYHKLDSRNWTLILMWILITGFCFARKTQSKLAYQVISWTLLLLFFKITFAFVDLITNLTLETRYWSSWEFSWQEFCFAPKSQPKQAYHVISWTLLACSLRLLTLL